MAMARPWISAKDTGGLYHRAVRLLRYASMTDKADRIVAARMKLRARYLAASQGTPSIADRQPQDGRVERVHKLVGKRPLENGQGQDWNAEQVARQPDALAVSAPATERCAAVDSSYAQLARDAAAVAGGTGWRPGPQPDPLPQRRGQPGRLRGRDGP